MHLQVKVTAARPRPGLVLHWAVDEWELPPEVALPPGTLQAGEGAVQTPFQGGESVTITFPEVCGGEEACRCRPQLG